ncbi:serine/threonine protein kinase, CMGC, dual-specificity [Coemansia sp. RSA 990]|nr:serine/threonine protein kinase, CMGC, dual-specificity [Coemansia sp. RSA 990]KAJ2673875.1 serine/threonine protein kinase, CMGC, dual-specificity [Coemansia sp. RSA 1085]
MESNGLYGGSNVNQAQLEGEVADLTAAVETMCNDFSQQSQRQRTLSWVSSAQSSNGASTAGKKCDGESADNTVMERKPGASKRQHVRLTTIDPVTGSIVEMSHTGSSDQPHSLDPGYIKEVYIKPDILHVASLSETVGSPSVSELSVDSSIGHLRGRFGSEHTSGETGSTGTVDDKGRATRTREYSPAGASNGSSLEDANETSSNDGAGSCCESNSTAQRTFMRGSQQAAHSKRNSGKHPARTKPPPDTEDGSESVDESGAKTDSETQSRIPLRASRRTTMGVGSGTSTLGLNYSNIFSGRPQGIHKAATTIGKAPSNTKPGQANHRTKARLQTATAESTETPASKAPSRIPVSTAARVGKKASSSTLAGEVKEPKSPVRAQQTKTNISTKANTMSRATASSFLNPHLRRRSKSGVFEASPPAESGNNNGTSEFQTSTTAAAIGVSSGAATISAAATKGRVGMSRIGAERHYVNRQPPGSDSDRVSGGGVLASTAAAGAAGRPRRMTHQATKLTIDPERARVAGATLAKRVPATATEPGSKFLRTPSNSDLPKSTSSSERDTTAGDSSESAKPSTSRPRPRGSTTFSSTHQPLQAKLETKAAAASESDRTRPTPTQRGGRPSLGAGARVPAWRAQQAVRESGERVNLTAQQRKSGSHVPGTKVAVQEAKEKTSSDDVKEKPRLKAQKPPVQASSRPPPVGRTATVPSSAASAIGIGSYNATGYQAGGRIGGARPGAAASVVGAIPPSQPSAAVLQQQQQQQQLSGVQAHVASYQQRLGGTSSVVSAAPAVNQQAMPMAFSGNKGGNAAQAPRASSAHSSGRMSTPATGGVAAMAPQEALARYGQQLSAAERTEILEYPYVYYVGSGRGRAGVRMYDDERGDYIVQMHDHLLYRYEILEVLGKGSFGQVLRARDHKTGDVVAVKIIRNRKRFHHQAQVEVKLLECLRRWDPSGAHHILQMTASFYFRSHLCIVMELLGMNLYEWLKAHQFAGTPAPLLRHFTVQMLQSLQLMGRHRIIHADLKPENILMAGQVPMPSRRATVHPLTQPQLGGDMQRGLYGIKVIDLGSSCFETERVYTYIQSRFYRAPEVILGLPYGPGIDMWSLGCIVAELLTGYPLFPGENEREQLWCMLEVLGPPPPYLVERAPRCGDFADAAPYGSQGAGVLANGACVTGGVAIRPYTNSKNKRRRAGARPLDQVLARARDPRLVDFVARTLAWDPAQRLTPEDALRHPWITDAPVLGMAQPAYVVQPSMMPHNAYMQMPPQQAHTHQHPQAQPGYGHMATARTRKA